MPHTNLPEKAVLTPMNTHNYYVFRVKAGTHEVWFYKEDLAMTYVRCLQGLGVEIVTLDIYVKTAYSEIFYSKKAN